MKLCTGFHCRGSDVKSGSCWAAGTNENKGECFMEGKEVEDKKLRLLESWETSLESLKSL